MTTRSWADALPPEGLVDQTGGAGRAEAGLIAGVPVRLGLALVFNATRAAELREAELRRRTRALGAGTRWRILLAGSSALLMVIAPGVLALLVCAGLLRWADRLIFAALGGSPPWGQALACGAIAAAACLITHAGALVLAPWLARHDEK